MVRNNLSGTHPVEALHNKNIEPKARTHEQKQYTDEQAKNAGATDPELPTYTTVAENEPESEPFTQEKMAKCIPEPELCSHNTTGRDTPDANPTTD